MKIDVTSIDGQNGGSIELSDEIFGLAPRQDLIARMIRYQLAKRQAGTHAVKGRADIWRTGKKLYKQKGTGSARHGSARVPQFRGGGRAHGPVVRSMRMTCPRRCAPWRCAMRSRPSSRTGDVIVWNEAALPEFKTKVLRERFDALGLVNALIIDGAEVDTNFGRAARNIPMIDVLPVQGINVYDILRRNKLVLTKAAVDALEQRFK